MLKYYKTEDKKAVGKFILKVSAITLAAATVVLLVASLSIAVFLPGTMSSMLGKLGLNGAAKIYAEEEYNKHATFDNLVKLSDASIKSGDSEYIVKYSGKMLNSPEFGAYVDSLVGGKDYFDFVASNYVLSLDKVGTNAEEVVAKAIEFSFTEKARGAGKYGAFEALIARAVDKGDTERIELLYHKLVAFKDGCKEAQKEHFNADLALLENIRSTR